MSEVPLYLAANTSNMTFSRHLKGGIRYVSLDTALLWHEYTSKIANRG